MGFWKPAKDKVFDFFIKKKSKKAGYSLTIHIYLNKILPGGKYT